MFSLEAPPGKHGKRKHGSIALASLTDSLHLQPAVWRSSKVQVAAPRISAKRVPRQQLKVVPTPDTGTPAFLLHQHKRAVQAALGLREEVSRLCLAAALHHLTVLEMFGVGCISLSQGSMLLFLIKSHQFPRSGYISYVMQVNCFVLSISTLFSNRLAALGLHIESRRSIVSQRQQHQEGLKFPWRRKPSKHASDSARFACFTLHTVTATGHMSSLCMVVSDIFHPALLTPSPATFHHRLSAMQGDCCKCCM